MRFITRNRDQLGDGRETIEFFYRFVCLKACLCWELRILDSFSYLHQFTRQNQFNLKMRYLSCIWCWSMSGRVSKKINSVIDSFAERLKRKFVMWILQGFDRLQTAVSQGSTDQNRLVPDRAVRSGLPLGSLPSVTFKHIGTEMINPTIKAWWNTDSMDSGSWNF